MTETGTAHVGRPPGLPKTGGRRKGTPNSATRVLQEKLDSVNCDPILELAKIAMSDKTPLETRVRCLSEIAPYLYPKRKPVDMPPDSTIISVSTNLNPGSSDGGDQPELNS